MDDARFNVHADHFEADGLEHLADTGRVRAGRLDVVGVGQGRPAW